MLWVACAEILNKTIHMSKPEIMGYLFKDNNVPIGFALLISNFLRFEDSEISGNFDNRNF